MKKIICKAWNREKNKKKAGKRKSLRFRTYRKSVLNVEKNDWLERIVKESIQKISPPVSLKKNILEIIRTDDEKGIR
ncbi:hypothetical protein [Methylacidiphilum caldifontis]|uniref:Uncharacterized protein n=1 Tax=Methylacidiphilum caldifontis TaxID=2795386 RepID=A0A4Y8PA04_9BACT|nr:hypothetical protein [Methylacidiphilum caldifontis]TFE67538.1 hypothetical protein A7Q10_09565 [Methylacidiphilum caldifontis]